MANTGQYQDGSGGMYSRIPSWDGNPATFRKYERDVELFIEGENLDVPFSVAARMVQKLSGTAKVVAELIPLAELRARAAVPATVDGDGAETVPAVLADPRRGIDRLLEDLRNLPGVSEVQRHGDTRAWFYNKLQRHKGEAIWAWCARFRKAIQQCRDEGVDFSNQDDLGWWFRTKTNLGPERMERLLHALAGDESFGNTQTHLMRMFPNLHSQEGKGDGPGGKGKTAWKPGSPPKKAFVADADDATGDWTQGEPGQPGGSDQADPGESWDDGSSPAPDDVDGCLELWTSDNPNETLETQLEAEVDALAAMATELGEDGQVPEDTVALFDAIENDIDSLAEALITLKDSKKRLAAAVKDRRYRKGGKGASSSGKGKSPQRTGRPKGRGKSGNRASSILRTKQNSECFDCLQRGHWAGDKECLKPGAGLGRQKQAGKQVRVTEQETYLAELPVHEFPQELEEYLSEQAHEVLGRG